MNQPPDNKDRIRELDRIEEGLNHGYEDCERLKTLIRGGKYRLDCGHLVTLNHNLGNNIAIINGKDLQIICTLCLY